MLSIFSKQFLTKDGTDDLFEKHYESDHFIEKKKIVENYVKQSTLDQNDNEKCADHKELIG